MKKLLGLTGLLFSCLCNGQEGFIYSVGGKIHVNELNVSLTHEHIISNFGGEPAFTGVYDTALLFNQVIPYLRKIRALGVHTVFDCTAAYFGRNVGLLKRLSDSTGINIITNTGIYGAAGDKYIPAFALTATAAQMAADWIAEFENGIDQTGIRPGFIKLAFDEGKPSVIDMKLFEAGIITHQKTGLTLLVHTGKNGEAAQEQLRLLAENKISPEAWIWAHADKMNDLSVLAEAAIQGAWISFDGLAISTIGEYVERIEFFRAKKLLHKVLLSHDGNSFPRGGAIRTYEALFTKLVPALIEKGFLQDEIDQLLIRNPREAFRIRTRNRG
jgi:predicted metal-dependent phosphotriesterase family hydrolase